MWYSSSDEGHGDAQHLRHPMQICSKQPAKPPSSSGERGGKNALTLPVYLGRRWGWEWEPQLLWKPARLGWLRSSCFPSRHGAEMCRQLPVRRQPQQPATLCVTEQVAAALAPASSAPMCPTERDKAFCVALGVGMGCSLSALVWFTPLHGLLWLLQMMKSQPVKLGANSH